MDWSFNKKYSVIIALALVLVSGIQAAESDVLSNEQKWEKLAEEVDTWADGIGCPLDEGIKEVVIGLNILDITTCQSCEGHLDWGSPFPWVIFDKKTPEWQAIASEIKQTRKEYRRAVKQFKESHPHISRAEQREHADYEKVKQHSQRLSNLIHQLIELELTQKAPLIALLNEFYVDRKQSYDSILVFMDGVDFFQLRSHGADFTPLRTAEEKEQKLAEYRKEMAAFAAFLKARYLNM